MANDSFGKIEGILDFCTEAPQAAPNYQERKKSIAEDISEKEVTDARRAQEYKDSYQGISDELAKLPKDKAVKTCSAYLESK
jgi:hypothetical protein